MSKEKNDTADVAEEKAEAKAKTEAKAQAKAEDQRKDSDPKDEQPDEQPEEPTVVDRAREYVHARFDADLAPHYLFHNYAYAEEIADKVPKLAKKSGLSEEQVEAITIAAWFFPLGYVKGEKNAAETSAELLREWAKGENYDLKGADEWIVEADGADADSSLPARVLHDAAWSWLGRKRYERRASMLQLERDALDGKEGDPVKFGEKMQAFLTNFQYLTPAGKNGYDDRRRRNVSDQQSNNYKIEQKEVKARTGKNFGRGIDTMYRTAFRNHINLSRIADGKANMMISINSIILSVLLAFGGASISGYEDIVYENPEFLVAPICLLLSSLTAVIFAVFSARPSVTEYRIKKQKLIKSKEASLLYFGNFLKLEKADFIKYMATMKLDQNSLYDDLSRDLYDLGAVLHKKYLLLTISYNVFVGGLALSVLSFLVVYLLNVY